MLDVQNRPQPAQKTPEAAKPKTFTVDEQVFALDHTQTFLDDLRAIRELKNACKAVAEAVDSSPEMRAKAKVLLAAIELLERGRSASDMKRDDYLKELVELNKDGVLDGVIAKVKEMNDQEFVDDQKQLHEQGIARGMQSLSTELQNRARLDRDEYCLIRMALDRMGVVMPQAIQEQRDVLQSDVLRRWEANFPADFVKEWEAETELRFQEWRQKKPYRPLPERFDRIANPYADMQKAREDADEQIREQQREGAARLRQQIERLHNHGRLTPEEQKEVDAEIEKARQRRKNKK
jgi:hypothetical protein